MDGSSPGIVIEEAEDGTIVTHSPETLPQDIREAVPSPLLTPAEGGDELGLGIHQEGQLQNSSDLLAEESDAGVRCDGGIQRVDTIPRLTGGVRRFPAKLSAELVTCDHFQRSQTGISRGVIR